MNYAPSEFKATLDNIAEGRIDVSPVLTGVVAPDGVSKAFGALSTAEDHAKIVVSFDA